MQRENFLNFLKEFLKILIIGSLAGIISSIATVYLILKKLLSSDINGFANQIKKDKISPGEQEIFNFFLKNISKEKKLR